MQGDALRELHFTNEEGPPELANVSTFMEQIRRIGSAVGYLVVMAKETPTAALEYVHDLVKTAIETSKLKDSEGSRCFEIDYQDSATAANTLEVDDELYLTALPIVGSKWKAT